jgi:hypothetical protein
MKLSSTGIDCHVNVFLAGMYFLDPKWNITKEDLIFLLPICSREWTDETWSIVCKRWYVIIEIHTWKGVQTFYPEIEDASKKLVIISHHCMKQSVLVDRPLMLEDHLEKLKKDFQVSVFQDDHFGRRIYETDEEEEENTLDQVCDMLWSCLCFDMFACFQDCGSTRMKLVD